MDIDITRWQPLNHLGCSIASFNFRVHGIVVRAATFKSTTDGYGVDMPFTLHKQKNGAGLTAIGLPGDVFQDVVAAATRYYSEQNGEVEDDAAGLRRVIGETLTAAGLGL